MADELGFAREFGDVVKSIKGYALRIAHRFLIGVPDMLLVVPGSPPFLLEAKRDALPIRLNSIVVTLSVQQHRTLWAAYEAGMDLAGVVSFAHRGDQFGVAVLHVSTFPEIARRVQIALYDTGTIKQRKVLMQRALENYLTIWGEPKHNPIPLEAT